MKLARPLAKGIGVLVPNAIKPHIFRFMVQAPFKRTTLDCLRRYMAIQMTADELLLVINKLKHAKNFFVYGVGNDTPFWLIFGPKNTVFVENHLGWMQKFQKYTPHIYKVAYTTKITDHKTLLAKDKKLAMKFPKAIRDQKWDCILVDSPMGFDDTCPGRMQSIFEASQLVSDKGYVFVHDINREVEHSYAEHYFGHYIKRAGQLGMYKKK